MAAHETVISVQSAWDGWRSAEVRLTDLTDLHWFRPNGAPRALVHGYISCSKVVSGNIPHECDRTSAPHRLRVCVLKSHTTADTYAQLAKQAGEQRIFPRRTTQAAISA